MKAKIKVVTLLAASVICGVSAVAIAWFISLDVISNRFVGIELAEAVACWALMGVLGVLASVLYAKMALNVKM